jgi:hypothetical protein
MRSVARASAYIYELVISLASLALAWFGFSGAHLQLPMLYTAHLSVSLLAAGIVGLTTVLLAMFGAARWPLSVWALAVFVLLFRGYFLSAYVFSGASGFWSAVWLTLGALLAFLLTLLRPGNAP